MTSLRTLTLAIVLIGLITGSLFVSTGISYGKDYQKRTLAVSQANYCGQGDVGMSVQCTNTVSQTQGNENGVTLTN
jgi:hypothetical protein